MSSYWDLWHLIANLSTVWSTEVSWESTYEWLNSSCICILKWDRKEQIIHIKKITHFSFKSSSHLWFFIPTELPHIFFLSTYFSFSFRNNGIMKTSRFLLHFPFLTFFLYCLWPFFSLRSLFLNESHRNSSPPAFLKKRDRQNSEIRT